MATMYIQIICFLAAYFVISICDAARGTAERNTFYKQVSTVSMSLDPRDYIVDPEVNQSYSYNNAHMDMMSEMTIFYYAEAVVDKHVTLSLTSSEERDYEMKFNIHSQQAYLMEDNAVTDYVNYARVDGNMMRFYVCFLGKMCPIVSFACFNQSRQRLFTISYYSTPFQNAVNVKYPLTHFKIESNDIHALMRIFIKGFFLDWATNVTAPTHLINLSVATITVNHHISQVHVCVFDIENQFVFESNDYSIMGFNKRELRLYGPRKIEVRFLSLRFAILMRIIDIETEERIKLCILMPDMLPTAIVVFTGLDVGRIFHHRCAAII
uniref:Hyphal_reg_CWP domain-containing protein n=1 Tax=Panagrellus redivivus TaxID=6233 RepID=A0A7E4VSU6_PANRE